MKEIEKRSPDDRSADIAIVGIACRFPGANNYREFWNNLIGNVSSVQEVPSWRWNKNKFYSQDRREENKTVSKWGGFLDGVDCFDAPFFNISRREAEFMDPQQRLMLELAWACFEDAGYAPSSFQASRTGVYVGVFNFDYKELVEKSVASIEGHMSTGLYNALIPNRISYFFNLSGPSIPVDTACSSSLVALHEAAEALRSGACETALVGGVNLLCTPTHFISFSKMGMLSRDGVCRTFDDKANGYVRGEGAAFVLLKPLDRAIRDDDRIWGVIRGTAVNHGGKVDTLTTPNDVAQGEVIAEAWGEAGIAPHEIDYIEAHGTGTAKGDPIEISGLKRAFSSLAVRHGIEVPEHSCGLGSVKANIGHLEAAAGMAGLIKTLLCMRHGALPALTHFTKLNTRIDFAGTPFYVVDRQQVWPRRADAGGRSLPRRAGVSSFGFGGVNAHVVIEEYVAPERTAAAPAAKGPALVVLSAKT
ncbi:MAG TPA: polyketide synthase, partial [Bradyrhizobium sp.]|nr:polyketide synthase [Bradyrhizobium sp.]